MAIYCSFSKCSLFCSGSWVRKGPYNNVFAHLFHVDIFYVSRVLYNELFKIGTVAELCNCFKFYKNLLLFVEMLDNFFAGGVKLS